MKVGPIVLDCARLDAPDLATVEVLARIGLLARDLKTTITIANANPRLRELIDLCGLSDVLRVDVEGQAE